MELPLVEGGLPTLRHSRVAPWRRLVGHMQRQRVLPQNPKPLTRRHGEDTLPGQAAPYPRPPSQHVPYPEPVHRAGPRPQLPIYTVGRPLVVRRKQPYFLYTLLGVNKCFPENSNSESILCIGHRPTHLAENDSQLSETETHY